MLKCQKLYEITVQKVFKIMLPASLCIVFSACEINIDTLRVNWCTPVKGATGVTAEMSVELEFNSDVSRADAEELFILENSDGRIQGIFTWVTGRRVIFTPVIPMEQIGRYTIAVPREIRDKDGNTMGSDFISDFYVGNDFVNPAVTSSVPPYTNGATSGIPVNRDIIINFSKSMNREKTQNAFSLFPDVSGYFVWAEAAPGLADSRLEYRLTKPMDYGKLYRLKLAADAVDTAGNRIGAEYRVNFVTGDNTIPPEIRAVTYIDGIAGNDDSIVPGTVKHNVSKNGSILIQFNNTAFTSAMDRQSVENAVSVTPSVAGIFDWHSDYEVEFVPSDSFDPETLYRFSVDTSCRDMNGLHLVSGYTVEFITDAEDSLLVKVGTVRGSNNNIDYAELGTTWPAGIEMGADAANTKYYISIQFMSSPDPSLPAVMQKYSIFDRIIIETKNYTTGASLPASAYISDISWLADNCTAVVRISGMTNDASAGQIPALYRLTVTGGKTGVKDEYGNYMKDDYVIEFREVP